MPDPGSAAPGLDPDEQPMELRRFARALREQRRLALAIVAAIVGVVLLYSLTAPPRYRATARVVQSTTANTTGDSNSVQRDLATSRVLATARPVLADAAKSVPGTSVNELQSKVAASASADANLLEVIATDGSASQAASIANAVANAFINAEARAERIRIAAQEKATQAQLKLLGADPNTVAQRAALQNNLSQLEVQAASAGSDLQLAEPAQPPGSPYTPRPIRNTLLALVLGMFVAGLVVLARDRLSPSVGGPRELARSLGLRLLAALPAPGAESPAAAPVAGRGRHRWRARQRAGRRAADRGAERGAERQLLAAVLAALPPGRRHTLLVTGAGAPGATTAVAAAIARQLAGAGEPCLLLRAAAGAPPAFPEEHIPQGPGFAEVLADLGGDRSSRAVVGAKLWRLEGDPTLHVLPPGERPPNPVDLLRPGTLDALFGGLAEAGYAYVVLEAPGLLEGPDARPLARYADGVVLACDTREMRAEEAAELREAATGLGRPLLGLVATGVAPGHRPVHAAPGGAPIEDEEPGAAPEPEELTPWVVSPPSANGSEGAGDAAAQPLLSALLEAGRPLTAAQLRVRMGETSTSAVRAQLRDLMWSGVVVREGSGRRGDPYLYAAVPPAEDDAGAE